ncbi:MAG TPA: NUDIX domain-containing protein [Candidatus Corynebacterium avicola]|uniref:NUDIX domain-containing protein n=1 Tax=Candidatus Corynebacterium avicola TaxID=2838527 RepID=A0A9D1RSN9_9CORY|nr:NUDIX domain-containing protein [Candidatus Corynebacterium avicola]
MHVSAVAILRDAPDVSGGREVLTVRKQGTELYQYPGGKPEQGESPRDAAVREIAEETGLTVDMQALTEIGSFSAVAANEPDTTVVADLFAFAVTGDLGEPVVAAEIAEAAWLPLGTTSATPDDPAHPLAPLMFETFPRVAARCPQ